MTAPLAWVQTPLSRPVRLSSSPEVALPPHEEVRHARRRCVGVASPACRTNVVIASADDPRTRAGLGQVPTPGRQTMSIQRSGASKRPTSTSKAATTAPNTSSKSTSGATHSASHTAAPTARTRATAETVRSTRTLAAHSATAGALRQGFEAAVPVGAGSPPQGVDQGKVDQAVSMAQMPPEAQSAANVLRSPNLNAAERDAVIQQLARSDNLMPFLGDATEAPRADQAVISAALGHAYRNGAINGADLLHISDANGSGNGAQRVLGLLRMDPQATAAGGPVEGLGQALSARADQGGPNAALDRAGAALAFTATPQLMANNLNTADSRAAAFEALVGFNQNARFAGPDANTNQTAALAATGRLFTAHGEALIDRCTATPPHTEVLASFMSQTVFNPNASAIPLDHSRDLVSSVRATLASAGRTYLARAGNPDATPLETQRAMEQYGRMTASVSGGAAVALDRYSNQIASDRQSRGRFAGMVGALAADLAAPTGLGSVVGQVANEVTGSVLGALANNPQRPSQAVAGVLYDGYLANVAAQEDASATAGLTPIFDSAYAAELLNLQQNLNVNLGGHQR